MFGVAEDSASAQLHNEQRHRAESTRKVLTYASNEEFVGSDDPLAQTPAAIINNCSLRREPETQMTVAGPTQSSESGAGPGSRKRQVSGKCPVPPIKRRLPLGGAPEMAKTTSGAGKLERPAFIYDDINKNKAAGVKGETLDVPKLAIRSLRSNRTAGISTETTGPRNAPTTAPTSDSGGRKTRSRDLKANCAEAGPNRNGDVSGEQLQQQRAVSKGITRRKRSKKSVGELAQTVVPDARTTRSGDRHLRSSGFQVVISGPERGKKPEVTPKVKKGSTRPKGAGKPSVNSENSADPIPVHGNVDTELSGRSQSPITKKKRLGPRKSYPDGARGGERSSADIQSGPPSDTVVEHDHTDGEISDHGSKRASEDEDEAEEAITAPGGPARSEVAVSPGSSEADRGNEDVDGDSDNGGWEGLDSSDGADVANEEDYQTGDAVNGRPKAMIPFGQQASWEKVLESAMSIGRSARNGVVEYAKPRLVTTAIKSLVQLSSELRQVYVEYGVLYANRNQQDESSSARLTALRNDVNQRLKQLNRIIAGIHEDGSDHEKRTLIRDIYAHAIPELVLLLNEVFLCYLIAAPVRHSGLKASLWVHGMVLDLCRKAVQWVAQPDTDRLIRRPTRESIFSALRKMRTVFRTEQGNMERSAALKIQTLASKRQLEESQEAERLKHEQYEREKDAFLKRQKAALDEEEERIRLLRRKFTSVGVPGSSSSQMPSHEDRAGETATSPGSDILVGRVELFGPRDEGAIFPKHRNPNMDRNHNGDDAAPSWTDEEREWLMIGLQMYQGEVCQLSHVPQG